jgi:hypothetical protein
MTVFNMRIAQIDERKKNLAAKVGIPERRFNEMLKSQRPMPLEARQKLLELLNLEEVWRRLNS